MQPKTVAIIGGGATATTFIRAFIKECIAAGLRRINLAIFEPALILGTGNAYQKDVSSSMINRPAQSMSADAEDIGEFFRWAQEKQIILPEKIKNASKPLYTSRTVFGYYLSDVLERSLDEAEAQGINVRIIKETVTRVTEPRSFVISTQSNKSFMADYVILCTGHNQPKDVYYLKGTPNYIHNPYPLHKCIKSVNKDDTIGIIGNSLTAIDIALALHCHGHRGDISMLTRQHVMPRVRGKISDHELYFFTEKAVKNQLAKKGELSLRDGLRLLRKELKLYGEPWMFLFREDAKHTDFSGIIANEIKASHSERPWQALMTSTNDVVECLWQALDHSSKLLFLKHYQRIWLNYRTPIPAKNARLLQHMARKNQLDVLSGLKRIQYDEDKGAYIADVNNHASYSFDWVFNASGPSRYVQPEDELLSTLLSLGMAVEHPLGGIDVDFHSAALINTQGQRNDRIRLLGHNTTGVYQYTASLEMIAKKSQATASNLVKFIKDTLHDSHQLSPLTHFDRASHSA